MLLWGCYTIKEGSRFRNKDAKIILAETNVKTFKSFKHMLQSCFKVISQNCEKAFTICLCDSWSLLDFSHFILILLSWLWNNIQSQQHKNKVRSGGSFRSVVAGGSVVADGWLVEDDFGWFQVVCRFSSYFNFIACRRVTSLLHSWSHMIDWGHSIFLFREKHQKRHYCCLVTKQSVNKRSFSKPYCALC